MSRAPAPHGGELQRPGKKTAKVHYRAGGWVAHHNTDLWRGTAPVDGAQWGMWPMGGAWLCLHLWEHYLYTGDVEHLKNSYPIMRARPDSSWMRSSKTEPDT